jgi:signal transduction histidine kinase
VSLVDPLRPVELTAMAEELASILRHDLRGKLSTLRNALYFLRRKLEQTAPATADPRVGEFFDLCERTLEEASELVGQRMNLDRLFAPGPERVLVMEAARAAREAARLPPGVTVEVEGDDSAVAAADPRELALAVRCLVENAAEAAGGVVRLEVRRSSAGVEVRVSDQGPGLSEEARAMAREPLRTTKPGHVGLGLNIADRIVRRYGGALAFPTGGSGTTVALSLPAA